MRILFVIRSLQIFHYYESIVSALQKNGDDVNILFDKKWSNEESVVDIKEQYGWVVQSENNFRRRLLLFFREVLSWRRYLLIKDQSSFYADRWLKYVSPKFRFLIKIFPPIKTFVKTNFVGNFFKNFEKNTKPDYGIIEDIKKIVPDVVVAGPVCYRQSSADLEYLKAALSLKIPTVVPVMTWDTLTTKGVTHITPDRLLVWNEVQIAEALEHHAILKEHIRVVGAPFFDKWFSDLKPSVSLSAEKYVLYLGSSDNIAPDERWLVKEIRNVLDNSIRIIFRPHPANFKIYQNFEIPGVSIIPKNGEMPKTSEALQDFYDILYHSSAVLSINTSGIVDAILAGKPVISLERKEFSKTQTLAQHYKHMRESNALYVTKTPEEFLEVFKKLLSGNDFKKSERENFIKNFIRPYGLDKSAGEMAVLEIENLVKNYDQK